MELLPNVHMLNRAIGANVFLLDDAESPTLIDAGLPLSGRRILRSLADAGHAPEELGQVLLTHYHPDHSGGAGEVRERTGAQVLCHAEDAELLIARGGQRRRRMAFRKEVPIDGFLSDNQVLPTLGGLQVLHTPGHTPGSLCFYLPEQSAVFVGDLFLHTSDRLSRPARGSTFDQEQYDASLRRIADLNVAACFPSHGPAILENASEAIWDLAGSQRRRTRSLSGIFRDVPRMWRFGISLVRK